MGSDPITNKEAKEKRPWHILVPGTFCMEAIEVVLSAACLFRVYLSGEVLQDLQGIAW